MHACVGVLVKVRKEISNSSSIRVLSKMKLNKIGKLSMVQGCKCYDLQWQMSILSIVNFPKPLDKFMNLTPKIVVSILPKT